jgi:hypothetical protein
MNARLKVWLTLLAASCLAAVGYSWLTPTFDVSILFVVLSTAKVALVRPRTASTSPTGAARDAPALPYLL